MTTPWSRLEPWDKAAQWLEAAPEVAPDLVKIAKDIAGHRMKLEAQEAKHRASMEKQAAAHRERMDVRLWYTQIASLVVNALTLLALTVVAIRFGSEATIPALTVVGASGGATAATAVVVNSVRKAWQRSHQEAVPHGQRQEVM